MMAFLGRGLDPIYYTIYNRKDEKGRVRLMFLFSALFSDFANVFITGTFYTGFLSQNGIDIVKVGIIAFIPYLTWLFGLFCPIIMHRFKKRKGILIANHYFYYGCVILATTVMPNFVKDPGQRTLWFAGLLFVGNLTNALLSGGVSAWHINFIPADDDQRTAYFSMTYLLRNVFSMVVVVFTALLTDALAGSEKQYIVLATMRYISFGLMCITGALNYLLPPEYPYKVSKSIKLSDVLTKPIRHKYLLMCAVIGAMWDFISQCNVGTWPYYLLNTVKIRYVLTYVCSITAAITSLTITSWWRRLIHKYGNLRVLMCNILTTAVLELFIGFTAPKTVWLFVVVSIFQGINLVGAQIGFDSIYYLCLPDKDTDIYYTFWTFFVNVMILLGQLLATAFIAYTEKIGTVSGFGMQLYGSQLLAWIKCAAYLVLTVIVRRITMIIQPQRGCAISVPKNNPEDLEETQEG